MIMRAENGLHYDLPDEWAIKIRKFEQIEKLLDERTPYTENRITCNMIREIVKGGTDKNELR